LLEGPAGEEIAPFPALPFPGPLGGPLRGPVLMQVGDLLPAAAILARGARLDPLAHDYAALADHVFGERDAAFAARARAHRGGFVVAGRAFGGGEPRDEAAPALALLGIRAVLARSFDLRFHRRLVQSGVLPLRLRLEAEARSLEAGDELEIPGLPESLETGKPLVVRDLTRGTQHALPHDLSAREVEWIRAGGLLAAIERPLAAESRR